MFEPKNILVPTDFSKYSNAALKKAADIAFYLWQRHIPAARPGDVGAGSAVRRRLLPKQ